MMEIIPWIIQRTSEPSTWAGFASLAVVFGLSQAEWASGIECRCRSRCGAGNVRPRTQAGLMGWLSAFSSLARLFNSLTGIYRDSRLRRTGAREARLAALEAGQARAKRLAEITAHLDTLDNDELDLRLRQYQRASGRLRMGKTNHRRRGR